METGLSGINQGFIHKRSFDKKKMLRFGVIGLIVLLVAAAVVTFVLVRHVKATSSSQLRTANVTKGDISVSITGSAPVESANRREISPKVTSTIKKIYYKAGDQVKEGDVLFELDDTDAQLAIEDAQNNIDQTALSQNSNSESISGLTVKAPFSGQISGIKAQVGADIGKGGTIATLTDTSKLKVVLPFSGSGIKGITAGKKAVVYLQDLMQSVSGTVSLVSKKPFVSDSGAQLYNVEITIQNPGSLKDGMQANAEITTSQGTFASDGSSSLSYIKTAELRSDAGGTVESLNVVENQFVDAGDVLAVLKNDDLKLSAQSTDLKLQGLQQQLQIKQQQLSYYKITAPCDGTIITQDVKEGDTVKPGDSLAVVSDMNHLQFKVNIDELDIAKIQLGQKVNITADALPETASAPLTGEISEIAMEGTSSNGVTTYPVTVTITDNGKLKIGMNVNAEIMVSEKNGVLMVPLEAVHTINGRSFVYVEGAGQNGALGSQGSGNTSGYQQGGTASQATRQRWKQNATGSSSGTAASSDQSGQQAGAAGPGGSSQSGSSQGSAAGKGSAYGQSGTAGQSSSARASRNRTTDPYYKNAHMVPVQTGINNDSYIEITSGLSEGEKVILPQINASTGSSSSTTNSSSRNSSQRFIGGGGGGGFMGALGGGQKGG